MAHPAHQPLHADIPWKRGVTLVAAALLMGVEEAWPGPLGTPTAPPPAVQVLPRAKPAYVHLHTPDLSLCETIQPCPNASKSLAENALKPHHNYNHFV